MADLKPHGFRAVRKTRVSEEIIEQVRDLITSGRLRAGDRLPPEREFAQTFGVGRSAVREAIRAMESLGLVEVRPGEGTFLAISPGGQGRDPLTATLYQAWNTQRKLFEVRRVLEPGLAGLAARRATAEQIEKMRTILHAQDVRIRAGQTAMKEDTSFHYLLAEAAGNEILLRIMDSLMSLLSETREASLQRGGRPARSLKQHRAILKAVEARDPATTEHCMREHIQEIEELAFAAQDRLAEQPLASAGSPELGVAP